MMLKSVDFPAPFSPARPRISPPRTDKLTLFNAWTLPKRFETPRTSKSEESFAIRFSPSLLTDSQFGVVVPKAQSGAAVPRFVGAVEANLDLSLSYGVPHER